MARIVGAISMSHAPGATGWPDAPEPAMKKRLDGYHAQITDYLAACKPDVIVAFLDDHFENHFRSLMPTFSIAIAPSHMGPAEHIVKGLGMERSMRISSDPELGEHLLRSLVPAGFDFSRMGESEYGNNLMTPMMLIRPEGDIPVLPIFINVFSPPLASTRRVYDMGAAVRQALEAYPESTRICLLATGGLSHWPPFWHQRSPEDDAFMARMKRYQTEGKPYLAQDPHIFDDLCEYELRMAAANKYPVNSDHPLVNAQWDRMIMQAIGEGDTETLFGLTYEDITLQGGHGGNELLNWMAVLGAMHGAPARVLGYEPVIEWICGMGYAVYDV